MASDNSGIDTRTLELSHILDTPSSVDQVHNRLANLKEELFNTTTPISQFLFVRNIPQDIFASLVEDHPRGVRLTALPNEHQILYRIIPGWSHAARIEGNFFCWISVKLCRMGLTVNGGFWVGGCGEVVGQACIKQPCWSFYPGESPNFGDPTPWPSLVLETGLPESLSQLRADARWWLDNPGQQTRFVILIFTSPPTSSQDVDIELWIPAASGPTTRSGATSAPRCLSSVNIRDGVVSGDELKIGFQSLMDGPQNTRWNKTCAFLCSSYDRCVYNTSTTSTSMWWAPRLLAVCSVLSEVT